MGRYGYQESDIEFDSGVIGWKNSQTDDDSSAGSPRVAPIVPSPEPSNPPRSNHCKKLLFAACFFAFIIAAAVVGLSLGFFDSLNPAKFFIQEDPPGRNETHEWQVFGNDGLDLIVENALVDSWTPYLVEYVEKWDAGYQDVDPLTLTIRKVEPESECYPSPGRLKVCNGDYGPTDWRGINISLLQNGFIVYSVAKLNDHWLQKEGETQMRYTMCHELGHGFGLAHTDENYWNVNTGECMDYTTRPQTNLDPGRFNFDLLASIYGTTTPQLSLSAQPVEPAVSPVHEENEDDRRRRRLGKVEAEEVPDEVMGKYFEALELVESSLCRDCVVDLGDECGNHYMLEVHQVRLD